MPTSQIYLVEMIISQIEMEKKYQITNIDNLIVNFKFANLINFDIGTTYFSSPVIQEDSEKCKIHMNYGKTFLFVSRSSVLRQLLQTDPFFITLYDDNKEFGSVKQTWNKEFGEMIKFFESLGIVKSTTIEENYPLKNQNNHTTATINVFLRMSCFGPNIQTLFQIKDEGPKEVYLFRQRHNSRIFEVERHNDDRVQPLVAPLYSGVIDAKARLPSQLLIKENVSLTQLFEREAGGMVAKDSTYQVLNDEGTVERFFKALILQFNRPSENKFFDLLNIISADVKTTKDQNTVTIQKKNVGRTESFLRSVGGKLADTSLKIVDEDDEIVEMTAERIARKLCGNKDCPAAKKFKEYGIGPLATGTALGTIHGDVEPPVTYGLSHTYGTMCEYGPYGVFSRPKHEELPFVPRNEPAPVPKPCKIMKRSGDGHKSKKPEKKKDPKWHSSTCPLCPERLRGGSDPVEPLEMEGENALMPMSPMIECKGVMDQFDSILAEYKKAIGPCGQATCPYAQTLADDTCKRMCDQDRPRTTQEGSTISCNEPPCNVEGCPYAGDTKKKRYPAGCGNPKCAYTKYKLGLVDEDAEFELQFLPPALASNCGDPHCKYPLAPPLPPIHWDCPDPLPKGPCSNLNCPFQPAKLKKLKTKKEIKTGPCGSPLCPYAFPQPCGFPTCPFAMKSCPMEEQEKQEKEQQKKKKKGDKDNLCSNPECPFADHSDQNIDGEFVDCANPDCISRNNKKKKKDKKKKDKKRKSPCGNPNCPFGTIKSEKPDEESQESICSNSECPASKKKNKCQESSSDSVSVCSDPDCPYADYKKQKEKETTDGSGSGSTCEVGSDDLCTNPNCPERLARGQSDVCPEPNCPYNKKKLSDPCNDPNCPYLKPLPSCGVPNCPYEPVPLRFNCVNPACPSKSVDFSKVKSKLGNGEKADRKSDDKGQNLPILQTTTVCEETVICDEAVACENPDCEMKEDGTITKKKPKAREQTDHKKKLRKRKKRGKFVYTMGDTYPGNKLGHKECVTPVFNVPSHMGWLWNVFTPILGLKPRRGWRPGALTKTIAARIRAHRQSKGLGHLRVPTFKKDGTTFDEGEVKVVPKPTLQIQKKEGTYWITMNPLKDPNTLAENEDPYMECTPMTFKITKNKKPQDDYCYCDGEAPLEENASGASSSSDSELDIEFTPPAGIIHPERFKKKPNVACCEAQYDPKDFEVAKEKGKGKGKDKGKGKEKKDKGKKGKGKKK
ncbi:uncharacterized protein LOC126750331 isoform X2 [Anthonomus grandis grandis]|uniref:uncharacterized protein LOC126750331 isoform X2 n=1 Tax=Anthonomus grandis grandis TaxID=2921223 RepID=UPI002166301D|nr:uncharacterized protein LOC126750331 isoform X2 [Anthonomus grandis grandis]